MHADFAPAPTAGGENSTGQGADMYADFDAASAAVSGAGMAGEAGTYFDPAPAAGNLAGFDAGAATYADVDAASMQVTTRPDAGMTYASAPINETSTGALDGFGDGYLDVNAGTSASGSYESFEM